MAEELKQPEANRYLALKPEVRGFLENLDEEDIEVLRAMAKAYGKALTLGGFFKWLATMVVATFAAVVSIGTAVKAIGSWLK